MIRGVWRVYQSSSGGEVWSESLGQHGRTEKPLALCIRCSSSSAGIQTPAAQLHLLVSFLYKVSSAAQQRWHTSQMLHFFHYATFIYSNISDPKGRFGPCYLNLNPKPGIDCLTSHVFCSCICCWKISLCHSSVSDTYWWSNFDFLQFIVF